MTVNPMDLTGSRVLVTGASSGLGRASAILMSQLGARLLLVARSSERLQETLNSLEGDGHQSLAYDLSDVDGIPAMLTEQAASFGKLDGVVHAAGILSTRPLRVSSPEVFESIYRVNVVAAGQLLRAITKRSVVGEQGCSVVLVGSVTSLVGAPGLAAYSASKAGLLGLMRSAALELAPSRIRVNAVLPGQFESPMADQQWKSLTEEQVAQIGAMHPLGIGQAEDVANCTAFLISSAARWVTGSSLAVDGGYTAH
jgi:NAD(P)-dependent dehydrogenase (short-subunit alcohol dehydrogenase family)